MDFSVKSFEVGPVAANCYILKDNDSNEGMVIDPGGNPDKILTAIKEMGVEVKLIALTHGHFDHIGGLDKVKKALNVPVAIHEADGEMLIDAKKNLSAFVGAPGEMEEADVLLKDGDNISFGGCSLKVIILRDIPQAVCASMGAVPYLVGIPSLRALSAVRISLAAVPRIFWIPSATDLPRYPMPPRSSPATARLPPWKSSGKQIRFSEKLIIYTQDTLQLCN